MYDLSGMGKIKKGANYGKIYNRTRGSTAYS